MYHHDPISNICHLNTSQRGNVANNISRRLSFDINLSRDYIWRIRQRLLKLDFRRLLGMTTFTPSDMYLETKEEIISDIETRSHIKSRCHEISGKIQNTRLICICNCAKDNMSYCGHHWFYRKGYSMFLKTVVKPGDWELDYHSPDACWYFVISVKREPGIGKYCASTALYLIAWIVIGRKVLKQRLHQIDKESYILSAEFTRR
jgi:hypothetical protein